MSKRSSPRQVNGILLLDKPEGLSSNQALQVVRRAFNAAKAGHTGNLDVAASGLLPLCLGEATKVCGFLLDSNKRYHAEIQLGQTSTTGDREGEITTTGPTIERSTAEIEHALHGFRGTISQVPPMYSALKRGGQPLYKLARQGIEVEREARQLNIHELRLVHHTGSRLGLDISCSKGTYIRSLAISLGEVLGCGAYLAGLRRVQAGPFELINAHSCELFATRKYRPEDYDELLLPVDAALKEVPRVNLNECDATHLRLGQAVLLRDELPGPGVVRVYSSEQIFLGMGTLDVNGVLAPKRLMSTTAQRKVDNFA
ncbi:MAG: tRNA pseudouridine(55) synthase TruB [Gammaproteobacteria bacterium]|nr:tRNA pseudouridine(55) synthase TruB [Gammaproteobacteria bacterium]